MTRRQYINSILPIKELTKVGFLKKGATVEEIEKRVCDYFGIKTIYQYEVIEWLKDHPIKAKLETFSKN